MRILAGSRDLRPMDKGTAVAIGIFDGVHLGHRQLLKEATRLAAADNLESIVYTFSPHPAEVLAPARAPQLIEPLEERLELFSVLGLDVALVERFDAEFAKTSAEDFVRDTLVGKLRAKHVIVGAAFNFGRGQAGNAALLQQLAPELGFTAHAVPQVHLDEDVVSSSRIRRLVADGEVAKAARLLGRLFTLVGQTVRGAGRGRKMGIPTANLVAQNALVPARGVYAAWVYGHFGKHPAVVNVGITPTFESEGLKVEAHLLDWQGGNLYGLALGIGLVERLRPEQRFSGPEALVAQIHLDIARARELLATG